MNKYRSLVTLLMSTALGLGAVGLLSSWIQQHMTVDTVEVVVAAQDIPVGTKLQSSMLKTVHWPTTTPLRDPIPSISEGVGRVVNMALFQEEPLLKVKLAPPGEKGGLSAQLPDGKRAVTVKVNEVVGVAGFALPGHFVDVMVNATDSGSQPVSKIVLERIQVLAVAQEVATPEGKPKVVNAVTLEVTPAQAEAIDLSRSIGTLSLVLRNQRDQASVNTAGVRKDDLLRTSHSAPSRGALLDSPARVPRMPAPAVTQQVNAAAPIIRGLALSAQ